MRVIWGTALESRRLHSPYNDMPSGEVSEINTWEALLMGPGIISLDRLLTAPLTDGAFDEPRLLVGGACMYCMGDMELLCWREIVLIGDLETAFEGERLGERFLSGEVLAAEVRLLLSIVDEVVWGCDCRSEITLTSRKICCCCWARTGGSGDAAVTVVMGGEHGADLEVAATGEEFLVNLDDCLEGEWLVEEGESSSSSSLVGEVEEEGDVKDERFVIGISEVEVVIALFFFLLLFLNVDDSILHCLNESSTFLFLVYFLPWETRVMWLHFLTRLNVLLTQWWRSWKVNSETLFLSFFKANHFMMSRSLMIHL